MQAIKIANIFNFEIRKKLITTEKVANAVLPGVHTIYDNPVVYDSDQNHHEFESYMKDNKLSDVRGINCTSKTKHRESSANTDKKDDQSQSNKEYSSSRGKSSDKEEELSIRSCKNLTYINNDDISLNNSDNENLERNKISDLQEKLELNVSNLKSSISTAAGDSITDHKETSNCRLFKSKSASRFHFVEEDKCLYVGVDVPGFVTQIINNNMIKTHQKFGKLLQQHIIKNMCEDTNTDKEINGNWASYLLEISNKSEDI